MKGNFNQNLIHKLLFLGDFGKKRYYRCKKEMNSDILHFYLFQYLCRLEKFYGFY